MATLIEGCIPISIIGYPKSGTTWVTRLVSDALNSRSGSGYLRHESEIASEGQNRTGKYFVLKSHYSKYDHPSYINPLKNNGEEGSLIIYIVRDFRDVLVSGFFHFNRNLSENKLTYLNTAGELNKSLNRIYFNTQIKRMCRKWCGPLHIMLFHKVKRFARDVLVSLRIKEKTIPVIVGNWSDHVQYWINFYKSIALIKYEDLLVDPFKTLVKAFDKLNIDYSTLSIRKAIQRQSFSKRKYKFIVDHDGKNKAFLRKGISGDWKRFLSPKMLDYVVTKHGEVLKELEYL